MLQYYIENFVSYKNGVAFWSVFESRYVLPANKYKYSFFFVTFLFDEFDWRPGLQFFSKSSCNASPVKRNVIFLSNHCWFFRQFLGKNVFFIWIHLFQNMLSDFFCLNLDFQNSLRKTFRNNYLFSPYSVRWYNKAKNYQD